VGADDDDDGTGDEVDDGDYGYDNGGHNYGDDYFGSGDDADDGDSKKCDESDGGDDGWKG
jgi:hypothetical protein